MVAVVVRSLLVEFRAKMMALIPTKTKNGAAEGESNSCDSRHLRV